MSAKACVRIALVGLAVLVAVSAALVWSATEGRGVFGLPPGVPLAIVKVAALVFVMRRVRVANVYTMQWTSMFVLLFLAEGLVRATSDPQPSSTLGIIEAVGAACAFAGLLMYLRPLKAEARKRSRR